MAFSSKVPNMFSFLQPRGAEIRVPRTLLSQLQLFQRRPELLASGTYRITSDVSPDVVDLFFMRVGGDTSGTVTPEKARQLRALCDELGFSGLDHELGAVLGGGNSEVRKQLVMLRGRVDGHDVVLEELRRRWVEQDQLQHRVGELERQLQDALQAVRALSEEVSQLRSANSATGQGPATPAPAENRQQQPSVPVSVRAPSENEFVYDPSHPLEGIIAHLTRQCGGNVADKGIVGVTASTTAGWCVPMHTVELGKDCFFSSWNEPNSWILYDFRERRVGPTSYSIRSPVYAYPKSWVLEVSNPGNEWVVVDRRDNNEDLKGSLVNRNFEISAPPGGSFQRVRFRQTGQNHDGYDSLVLTSLELFGTLSPL